MGFGEHPVRMATLQCACLYGRPLKEIAVTRIGVKETCLPPRHVTLHVRDCPNPDTT